MAKWVLFPLDYIQWAAENTQKSNHPKTILSDGKQKVSPNTPRKVF